MTPAGVVAWSCRACVPAELIDLAQAVGAGPLDADTAERLLQHTAGHPLHARALLTEFGVRGLIDADGILPAPRALATLMVARLGGLPPAARQLVEAVARLGPVEPVA